MSHCSCSDFSFLEEALIILEDFMDDHVSEGSMKPNISQNLPQYKVVVDGGGNTTIMVQVSESRSLCSCLSKPR